MTTETAAPTPTYVPERRFRLDWLLPALLRPRATFAKIGMQAVSVWLVPLLILTVFAIGRAAVSGNISLDALSSGAFAPPPDVPPEQAQQFQQAQGFASNPLLIYVFPTLLAVAGVWAGWLLVGGLLHLLLTLFGGRGSTRSALNVVAWAALPFALRDLVRIIYMLATRSLIASPGLSGFAPGSAGVLTACFVGVFGQVDLYLIWHVLLISLGVRAADQLPQGRALVVSALTVLLVTLLAAAPATVAAFLGAAARGGGPF